MKRFTNRLRLLLLVALAAFSVAVPARAADTPAKAVIQIPQLTFDFGEASEGGEINHDFIVQNTGAAPLEISEVKSSCGCTVARFDKTIPPGGEGKISVKVNLKNQHAGDLAKNLVVFSNASNSPKTTISVSGKVKAFIEVSPMSAIFFRGLPDQVREAVVELRAVSRPFHIQKVVNSVEDKMSAKVETVEDGRVYRIAISNLLKKGNYSGTVVVHTDIPEKPEILLRITAQIEGEVSVTPPNVFVGVLTANQPSRTAKVSVRATRGKAFKITKLDYDTKLLNVTSRLFESDKPEKGYIVEIVPDLSTIPANERRQTKVTIETDAGPDENQTISVQIHNMKTPEETPAREGREAK